MQVEFLVNMKDLVVLVADKNMEFLIRGLLPRIPVVEGLKTFTFDVLTHPYRDAGVFNDAADFLRPLCKNYSFAIVMLDHHGSGREHLSREEIENAISERINKAGWDKPYGVICIKPELENWIWVNRKRMEEIISWESELGLDVWLQMHNWKSPEKSKPDYPKEALQAAMRASNTPRSSSIYYGIASQASYRYCEDASFQKMLILLKYWFGE